MTVAKCDMEIGTSHSLTVSGIFSTSWSRVMAGQPTFIHRAIPQASLCISFSWPKPRNRAEWRNGQQYNLAVKDRRRIYETFVHHGLDASCFSTKSLSDRSRTTAQQAR